MIYEDNGKKVLLLNLEKQVQKNKEDIEYIVNQEGALNQFGLKVVGQVDTIGDMPTVQAYKASNPKWEYGDAFMVGVSTAEATVVDVDKAVLLVLTRANTKYPNDFWMNLKEFPKPGPVGPEGKQGEQGIQGEHGLNVESGIGLPAIQAPQGTTYINATTGDVYRRYNNIWQLIGNIKGATGSVGPAGPIGVRGPIGPTGATGAQGPRGIGVNILGTLTSTSQLPDPTTVGKDSAYIIPADGVNHLWVIEGTDNLVWTDFGTAGLGEKGDKGDAGVGINTMTDLDLTYGNATVTYNTNDGMTINGQARFTYDGGTTKDVTMDIDVPIVANDTPERPSFISIDKVNGQEKVGIRLDDSVSDFMLIAAALSDKGLVTKRNGAMTEVYYGDTGEPYSIVQYGSTGAIKTYVTEDDYDAVYKEYADDTYVAKHSETTPTHQAYVKNPNGTQTMFGMARTTFEANTIVVRDVGGVIKVGTPVGVNDATTKAYVDGLHHYSHHIQITDGTSEIFITLAVKNYPNAVTTLDGVTELVGALTEQVGPQPIMATGVVDGHNVHAVLVQDDRKLYARYYDSAKGILTDKVQILFNDTATVSDIVA